MSTRYKSPKSRQGSLRGQLLNWSTPFFPEAEPASLRGGGGGVQGLVGVEGRCLWRGTWKSSTRGTAHSQQRSRHSIDAHWGRSFCEQSSTTHLDLLACSRPLRRALFPAVAPSSGKRGLLLLATSPPGPALNLGVMHSYELPSTAMHGHAMPRYGLSLSQAPPFKTSRHASSPSSQKDEMKMLMASFQKYECE